MIIFAPDGTTLGNWQVQINGCCAWRMIVAPDGTLRVPAEHFMDGSVSFGVQIYSSDGTLTDIVWVPDVEYERVTYDVAGRRSEGVPFAPGMHWGLRPTGAIVVGASDNYSFEVWRNDLRVLHVTRNWIPIPVSAGEREWMRRWFIANIRNYVDPSWQAANLRIPEYKPAFRDVLPTMSGELWVFRDGPSEHVSNCIEDPLNEDPRLSLRRPCWRSSRIVDVFDEDGRYLGQVSLPDEIVQRQVQIKIFVDGDMVIAATEDEYGTIKVKKYRIRR